MAENDDVKLVYDVYQALQEAGKDKISEHKDDYLKIFTYTKSDNVQVRQLVPQIIGGYIKHFPECSEDALNQLYDMLEDGDANVRRRAIQELSKVAAKLPTYVHTIASVLAQVYISDNTNDHHMATIALTNLISVNAKDAILGVFSISSEAPTEGEENLRLRSIRFVAQKLKDLKEETMTKELEDAIHEECKKGMKDCQGDEFIARIQILASLKCCQTLTGRQNLVDMVAEKAAVGEDFNPTNEDDLNRIMICTQHALPYFSKNVASTKFVTAFLDKIVPNYATLACSEQTKEDMLKALSEMAPFCGDVDRAEERLGGLLNLLKEYMSLPSQPAVDKAASPTASATVGEEAEEKATENGSPTAAADEKAAGGTEPAAAVATPQQPKLCMTKVEALLYSFHQIGKKHPEFLEAETNSERLQDFCYRLQYFARLTTIYVKKLRATLQSQAKDELKSDENKMRILGLKTTSNINTLIRDLFHKPPSYKSSIVHSWKPPERPAAALSGAKRKGSVSEENGASAGVKKAVERKIYAPPTGKFSEKAGNAPEAGYGRGGRGRGGGWRGGRGGGWRGGGGGGGYNNRNWY